MTTYCSRVSLTGDGYSISFATTTGPIDFGTADTLTKACIVADAIVAHVMEPRRNGEVYKVKDRYYDALRRAS